MLILGGILSLYAQETPEKKPKFFSGDTLAFVESTMKKVSKNVNFTIIPGPTYNVTQRLGLAVLPVLVYNLDTKDKLSPPSSTAAVIYFDFYGSWLTAVKQSFYWDQNKWRAIAFVGYGHLLSKYYGVGNDTAVITNKDTNYVWLRQKPFQVDFSCYRKIVSHLYGGLEYAFVNSNQSGKDSTATAEIEQDSVHLGTNIESKLIPSFIWDNRNNVFWSTKGYYAALNFQFANKAIASSKNFGILTGYVSGYYKLIPNNERLSMAWRFFARIAFGDVPYDQLSIYCRGDDAMGYTPGKYADLKEVNAQWEIRYDVWKIICISINNGIGKIFPSYKVFGQSVWLPWASANLYINMIPYRNIRLRLSAAIARHDYGLYIGVGQLF